MKTIFVSLLILLTSTLANAQQPVEVSTINFQPGVFVYQGNMGFQFETSFVEKDALVDFMPFLPQNETQGVGFIFKKASYLDFAETGFFFSSTIDRILPISQNISTVINLGLSSVERTTIEKKTTLALFVNPEVHFLPLRLNETFSMDGFIGVGASLGNHSFVTPSTGINIMYTW